MKKVPGTSILCLVILTLFAGSAAADITKVVNGASFASNNNFSPGTIITIKGTNLANTTATAQDRTRPPKTLGGITVTVGGIASELFYVSPTQVNARIDSSVPLGSRQLVLTTPSNRFTRQIVIAKAGAAGIFSLLGSGSRDGAICNAISFKLGPFVAASAGKPTYLAIFATGLDLSTKPKVTVDGVELPVLWWGNAPGFSGLQQINVQLLPQLAGAGRVGVVVTAGGRTTNVVEIVILPAPSQTPAEPEDDDQPSNRVIAAIAWVPGTSLALVTDENDDVVRVLDIKARRVSRTITLPKGSRPSALAVDEAGKIAVVAERDRDRVAILDLTTFKVLQEVKVGGGPSAVSINSNVAVVLNMDTDDVSILNLTTRTVIATLEVGRTPRDIASDLSNGTWRAYVTNLNDGTISVIDVPQAKVINTLHLGEDVRPQSMLVLPGLNLAIVTEPTRSQDGRALMVNLTTGVIVSVVDTNPASSGGASDMALFGDSVYFNNQSAGSVTAAKIIVGPTPSLTPRTIKAGVGARAMTIDQLDKLLLVANQGTGEVVLIDLLTNVVVGRINGVLAEDEQDVKNDRDDRDRAANVPVVTSIAPSRVSAPTVILLTVNGKNLDGADEILLFAPGSSSTIDRAIAVTNIRVNSAGTQLTAVLTIPSGAAKGDRLVLVETPNGESSLKLSSANSLKVE